MVIFPAIDIKNGQCVRLNKGDFSTAEKVAADPLDTAMSFERAGAKFIHMVDLDGAAAGRPVNTAVFRSVSDNTGLTVQVGGGIRDLETVQNYMNSGVKRVILGSAALKDPEFVKTAIREYGDSIIVGIDALHRQVKTEGWMEDSDTDFIELSKRMEDIGVRTIIFTDISKDGMMNGPNLTLLEEIEKAVSCDIIASGGVTTMDDLENISRLGIYGAICGKSIYKGTIDLKAAIERYNI